MTRSCHSIFASAEYGKQRRTFISATPISSINPDLDAGPSTTTDLDAGSSTSTAVSSISTAIRVSLGSTPPLRQGFTFKSYPMGSSTSSSSFVVASSDNELVLLGDKEIEETNGVSGGPANNKKEFSNASSEVSSSSKGSKKRKGGACGGSSLHEEFKMLKSSLDTIASVYGHSSPCVIPEDKLFKEVEKIEGLNEDAVLVAYDFVCGDPVRGRTFVGMPVNRRKRWLEIKLGHDFEKKFEIDPNIIKGGVICLWFLSIEAVQLL